MKSGSCAPSSMTQECALNFVMVIRHVQWIWRGGGSCLPQFRIFYFESLTSDIFNNELMRCPYKYKSHGTLGGNIMPWWIRESDVRLSIVMLRLCSQFRSGFSNPWMKASGIRATLSNINGTWALQERFYSIATQNTTYVTKIVNKSAIIQLKNCAIFSARVLFLYTLKIYNLIVPILLVTVAGISSVFLPLKSDSKLNMAVTVVLTFIFLQTLVAAMIPKTPTTPKVRDTFCRSYSMAFFHMRTHFEHLKVMRFVLNHAGLHSCY